VNQVILNSKYYDIVGDIRESYVNPWTAKLSQGEPVYSDVSQGSLKEWHDFRGGVGLESELGGEVARLWWSEGVNTSIEKCLIMGPKVTTAGTFNKACVDIFDFLGSTYAYGDNLIAKWNTGTSEWDSKQTGLNDPISHCVVTDETATYAVISSATTSYKSTDGTTWTEMPTMMGHLAVIDHRLCGLTGNTLYFSPYGDIDGTVSTKQFSGYLGTVYGMFQGKLLTTGEPVLYVHTNEGLFALDFWTKQIYKQEISFPPYTYAGHAGMYWNSYVWVSTGPGIKKVTSSLTTDVGPDQDDGLPSGYQGVIYDIDGSADWLVYCVNGGSANKSSIFKRHGTLGGNHQIYTTSAINKEIRCVHISPSSMYARGRLWWGEDTGIKYCDFPDFNANPMEISGYTYATTGGKCTLPIFRPLAVIPKVALRCQPLTENCTAARYVTLYYDIFDGNGWVSMGNFTSSPLPTVYQFGGTRKTGTADATEAYKLHDADGGFAASDVGATVWNTTDGTYTTVLAYVDSGELTLLDNIMADTETYILYHRIGTQFYRIKFGVEMTTDSATETPKLESLMFTWMARPTRIKSWTFTVTARGNEMEDAFTNLQTAANTNTLLTFYPSGDAGQGTSYKVVVTTVPQQVTWGKFWNRKTGQVNVTVQEVFTG